MPHLFLYAVMSSTLYNQLRILNVLLWRLQNILSLSGTEDESYAFSRRNVTHRRVTSDSADAAKNVGLPVTRVRGGREKCEVIARTERTQLFLVLNSCLFHPSSSLFLFLLRG